MNNRGNNMDEEDLNHTIHIEVTKDSDDEVLDIGCMIIPAAFPRAAKRLATKVMKQFQVKEGLSIKWTVEETKPSDSEVFDFFSHIKA